MVRPQSESIICDYSDGEYSELSKDTRNLTYHHVMNGPLRDWADKEGLWVCLTFDEHYALHNTREGQAYAKTLKQKAQQAYEKTHSRQDWMKKVRKNYL